MLFIRQYILLLATLIFSTTQNTWCMKRKAEKQLKNEPSTKKIYRGLTEEGSQRIADFKKSTFNSVPELFKDTLIRLDKRHRSKKDKASIAQSLYLESRELNTLVSTHKICAAHTKDEKIAINRKENNDDAVIKDLYANFICKLTTTKPWKVDKS